MNTRIQPVSAFAVAVAALLATTAIADEGKFASEGRDCCGELAQG
jgi:hypothetical protein